MNGGALEREVNHEGPTKIWNKMFISLFLTNAAFNLGMTMSNSILSVYVDTLGAAASAIGIVMGTFTISSILMRLVSAPIMDTYNRKYIVVLAAALLTTAFFGFSISKDVPMLLVFRLVQGAGMAFGNACCLAMVSETLPKDKYSSGIGYYSLAQVMCQAVGPLLGLTLAHAVGYSMTFIFTACVMMLSAFLALQVKVPFKRTKRQKLSFRNIIAPEAILPATLMFLVSMGGTTVGSFLIIFASNQGVTSDIGLYFTTTAIMMLITRPFIGRLTDRFGIAKVAVPALLFNILSFFVISFSHSLVGFLLAAVISAFGQGACQPAIMALSMKAVPNDRRGAASSTNYIGMDLGALGGPLTAGFAAQAFGYVSMWRVMTIPSVIAIVFVLVFRGRITRIEKDFTSSYS